jgi:hypothetical protein
MRIEETKSSDKIVSRPFCNGNVSGVYAHKNKPGDDIAQSAEPCIQQTCQVRNVDC